MAKIPEESYPNKTGDGTNKSIEAKVAKARVEPEMLEETKEEAEEPEESEEK